MLKEVIKHKLRLINALFFAMVFSVVGYFIPLTYKNFIDKRVYFEMRQPAIIQNGHYCQGEHVRMIVNRKSEINTVGSMSMEAVTVVDGNFKAHQLQVPEKTVVIEKTDGFELLLIDRWVLPEDIANGDYFLRGILEYEVAGVKKVYPFITEEFLVDRDLCHLNQE